MGEEKPRVSLSFDLENKKEARVFNYLQSLGRTKSKKTVELFTIYLEQVEIKEKALIDILGEHGIGIDLYKSMLKAGITTAQMEAMVLPQGSLTNKITMDKTDFTLFDQVKMENQVVLNEIKEKPIDVEQKYDRNITLSEPELISNNKTNDVINEEDKNNSEEEDDKDTVPKITAELKNKMKMSLDKF